MEKGLSINWYTFLFAFIESDKRDICNISVFNDCWRAVIRAFVLYPRFNGAI